MNNNEDIYKYQFDSLINNEDKMAIITVPNSLEAINNNEFEYSEFDFYEEQSNLLFDLRGVNFDRFKAYESEYRYWIEICIIKIIKNLLDRYGISYIEKYYGDGNEQDSLVISNDHETIESYFLFDISTEEPNYTEYDLLYNKLKSRAYNIDKIFVYIFRDRICSSDIASLVNNKNFGNTDGYLQVLPLKSFFEKYFGPNEYSIFEKYASNFHSICNKSLNYKTVIVPTQKSLNRFKKNKLLMLKELNYKQIKEMGMSGTLTDEDFKKIHNQYINKELYKSLLSDNDFADSFITSEWSYDVIRYAMGELELTGIIAGYLKSIEQLLFKIVKFHSDEGIPIRLKNNKGRDNYTSTTNEFEIDTTLGSLIEFISSKKAKLALNVNIRGCLKVAITKWKDYQRNGYFHKHNLYSENNKIDKVRLQTLYLYFLILGGIDFKDNELIQLGLIEHKNPNINSTIIEDYENVKKWFINLHEYDLPDKSCSLFLSISSISLDNTSLKIHLYRLNDDYMNVSLQELQYQEVYSHLADIPPYKIVIQYNETTEETKNRFLKIFKQLLKEYADNLRKINEIYIWEKNKIHLLYKRKIWQSSS